MKCNYNRGITLVETLVAVMILSVLALSLYTVFKSGIDAWTKSESRLEIYQNARAALDQISRELAGAFATPDDPNGAKLVGVDGGAGSDTLTFITDFADSIYKIKYHLEIPDATYPNRKILWRDYIDYSTDTGKTYTSDAATDYHLTEFVKYTKSASVDNIQFTYLAQTDSQAFLTAWGSARPEWPGTGAGAPPDDTLPEAVKIVITMRASPYDPNGATYDFETIVYLPNSEVE